MMKPIIEKMLSVVPVNMSARKTPISENGSDTMIADRLQEARELRREDQVDEDHREAERRHRRRERVLHLLLLPADREAIAGRKRRLLDDLVDVLADVARRAPLRAREDGDASHELLAADGLRARRLDDLGDLPQRHHAQFAVRPALVRREVEVRQVRRDLAAVLGEAHVHLVVLRIRREPVAHCIAREQRTDRRADLLHRDAEVRGRVVVEAHRQRGIGRLLRQSRGPRCRGRSRASASGRSASFVSVAGSGPRMLMKIGRLKPSVSSTPGIGFSALRIARSRSFCVRSRSARSVSLRLMRA